MRPNLSVENIAGALAVLGTSVLMAACGGGDKPPTSPVNSTETPAGAGGEAKPADGHCGAGKDQKSGDASCGAKPNDEKPAEPAATPAAAPAPAAGESAKVEETKAAETKADPKADAKKPADGKKTSPAGKKSGAASCGAGTCAAKK